MKFYTAMKIETLRKEIWIRMLAVLVFFLGALVSKAQDEDAGFLNELGNAQALDSYLSSELLTSLRDPFQVPQETQKKVEMKGNELEQYSLGAFKLTGVITGPKKVKALVTAPSGQSYFVSIGDRLGMRDGRITAVQPERILVVEEDRNSAGKKIKETFEVNIDGTVNLMGAKKPGSKKL